MQNLKKAIKAQRPANLTDYVIAYCIAIAEQREHPITVDVAQATSSQEMNQTPAHDN